MRTISLAVVTLLAAVTLTGCIGGGPGPRKDCSGRSTSACHGGNPAPKQRTAKPPKARAASLDTPLNARTTASA